MGLVEISIFMLSYFITYFPLFCIYPMQIRSNYFLDSSAIPKAYRKVDIKYTKYGECL